jgi:hypothetical protein
MVYVAVIHGRQGIFCGIMRGEDVGVTWRHSLSHR